MTLVNKRIWNLLSRILGFYFVVLTLNFPLSKLYAAEVGVGGNGSDTFSPELNVGFNVDSLTQVTLALLCVVLVIVILSVFLKKLNILPSNPSGIVKIIAGVSLGSKDRLLLIQVGEEQVLISAGPSGTNKIHTLSVCIEPGVAAQATSLDANTFAAALRTFTSRSRS